MVCTLVDGMLLHARELMLASTETRFAPLRKMYARLDTSLKIQERLKSLKVDQDSDPYETALSMFIDTTRHDSLNLLLHFDTPNVEWTPHCTHPFQTAVHDMLNAQVPMLSTWRGSGGESGGGHQSEMYAAGYEVMLRSVLDHFHRNSTYTRLIINVQKETAAFSRGLGSVLEKQETPMGALTCIELYGPFDYSSLWYLMNLTRGLGLGFVQSNNTQPTAMVNSVIATFS
jgi:hypothetical protein